jgi:hypothetical protein
LLYGIKIKATLIGGTLEGSVARGCPQRGTLPHSCEAWLKTNSQRDSMGMAVTYWGGYVVISVQKIRKYRLTASSRGFEYGTTVVW